MKLLFLLLSSVGLMQGARLDAAERAAIANPASVACVQADGKIKIYLDKDGAQDGYCTWGAAAIGEWTMFKANSGTPQKAVTVFTDNTTQHDSRRPMPIVNPAYTFCYQQGGDVKHMTSIEDHSDLSVCEFSDHSSLDIWTLYYGSRATRNSALSEALHITH